MAEKSNTEVYSWLKALSPGMKLERLSPNFECRGFRSRRSLQYLKQEDLDTFFESPNKLLLAEKRVLAAELQKLKEVHRPQSCESSKASLQPKRLEWSQQGTGTHPSYTGLSNLPSNARQNYSSSSTTGTSPLDRRAIEHTENLQVLAVQVESAKQQLEYKRKAIENIGSSTKGRKTKTCATCHLTGHNKSKCAGNPCVDATVCKLPEKHPELNNEIKELQKDLKELEKKYMKTKSENEVFVASRQRVQSSFFSVMRPRLKKQNLPKYVDRYSLDRDLQVLQRALSNQIPPNEDMDW